MNLSRKILELKCFAFLPDEDDATVLSLYAGQLVAPRHPNLLDLFLQQVLNGRGTLSQVRVLLVAEYEEGRTGKLWLERERGEHQSGKTSHLFLEMIFCARIEWRHSATSLICLETVLLSTMKTRARVEEENVSRI